MIFAGTPPTSTFSGTSRFTHEHAATTLPSLITMFPRMVDLAPIQQPLPTFIVYTSPVPALRSAFPISWPPVKKDTSGAMSQLLPISTWPLP